MAQWVPLCHTHAPFPIFMKFSLLLSWPWLSQPSFSHSVVEHFSGCTELLGPITNVLLCCFCYCVELSNSFGIVLCHLLSPTVALNINNIYCQILLGKMATDSWSGVTRTRKESHGNYSYTNIIELWRSEWLHVQFILCLNPRLWTRCYLLRWAGSLFPSITLL